jgi:SAM-dependent methyltransferase
MSQPTPQERFTGLAAAYAQHRPDYPPAAYDFMTRFGRLQPGARIIDLGCGTGISTRQLAQRGWRVIGIEPNVEMLTAARAETAPGTCIDYLQAQAEAVPLPADFADAILAAQAFHWFDPAAALAEARRLLRPGGSLFLMWYERTDGDPFNDAYTAAVHRHGDQAAELESQRKQAGEVLLTAPGWADACRERFPHQQAMDEAGVLGRAQSISYGPKTSAGQAALAAELRLVFQRFQRDGNVVMKYTTTVYAAHKPE